MTFDHPSRSYQSVLPAVMPRPFATATADFASAVPCLRAAAYELVELSLIVGSIEAPYRGNRPTQELCGPSVIGSSLQPLVSWVLIQVLVRFGWLRQAREAPEM